MNPTVLFERVSTQRVLHCTLNGRRVTQPIAVHQSLAEVLRDNMGLTGTKVACNQAACGACTVLLDGEAVFACHTLAAQAEGAQVQTIEGLASGDTLHPLQAAFIQHDALQCGFCTPGMLMAIEAAVRAGVPAERSALRRAISGNVCRCGAYEAILDAALSVMAP